MTTAASYEPTLRRLADPEQLGLTAAADIAEAMRARLRGQPLVRVLFAAAPSQQTTLRALAAQSGIDWPRVVAFQLDEYLGLPSNAPQRFGAWLTRVLFDHVPIGAVQLISPDESDDEPDAEPDAGGRAQPAVARYAALLAQAPLDIGCLGVGVNGHLAFNDPPADFDDPALVKVVDLDDTSRRQQVDDDCFERLDDVPRRAITLTIPAMLSARQLFCMVPGAAKRTALTRALHGPITAELPASALRLHPRCTIYADAASSPDAAASPDVR